MFFIKFLRKQKSKHAPENADMNLTEKMEAEAEQIATGGKVDMMNTEAPIGLKNAI